MPERKKAYPLRVEPALWAALERCAAADFRSVNAEIGLSIADGRQLASIRGAVRELAVNGITIASADIEGAAQDLFGVPAITGTMRASDVVAAGTHVETLTADATQSAGTTSFDAQAALATGTDIDIAGALTPVDGGYRLAVDRAQLQQGQLSARLARPTVIQVAGSSVAVMAGPRLMDCMVQISKAADSGMQVSLDQKVQKSSRASPAGVAFDRFRLPVAGIR